MILATEHFSALNPFISLGFQWVAVVGTRGTDLTQVIDVFKQPT